MSRLIFDGGAVRAQLDLSLAANLRRPTIEQQVERVVAKGVDEDTAWRQVFQGNDPWASEAGEDIPAGLWIIHDEGCYCMNNAYPFSPGVIAYAQGMGPHRDPSAWNTAAAAVGGDDFCCFIPAADFSEVGPGCTVIVDVQLADGSMYGGSIAVSVRGMA